MAMHIVAQRTGADEKHEQALTEVARLIDLIDAAQELMGFDTVGRVLTLASEHLGVKAHQKLERKESDFLDEFHNTCALLEAAACAAQADCSDGMARRMVLCEVVTREANALGEKFDVRGCFEDVCFNAGEVQHG